MQKHGIICPHCGYRWFTGSKLVHATYPSCQGKVWNSHADPLTASAHRKEKEAITI